MLEVDEHVLGHAFVERTEIRGTMPEGVLVEEVVEVPVDELPVETVVVGNEHRTTAADLGDPVGELLHNRLRIVEPERFFPCEAAHLERLGNPFVRDRFQLPVERPVEGWLDHNGPEADHRIVARYRAVCFYVHHDVGHVRILPQLLLSPMSQSLLDITPFLSSWPQVLRFRSAVYFHHGFFGSPAMNRTAEMNTSITQGSWRLPVVRHKIVIHRIRVSSPKVLWRGHADETQIRSNGRADVGELLQLGECRSAVTLHGT